MSDPTIPRSSQASAPLRLDFAGGWTDVPPFSAKEGGLVVNATIGLYVHAEVEPGGHGITLRSEDLGEQQRVDGMDQLHENGKLALLQTALRMYPVIPCTITSRSEAPAGSGLGSSGALDVALVSALTRARGETLDRPRVAESAWRLEVVEAGMPGGKQDQWASALGGFRRLTFRDPEVEAERLEIDPTFRAFLERHTILCYTGTSRISGKMISRVVSGYERGDPVIVSAFRSMKDVASRMVEALLSGDPELVGRLLNENWAQQCRLDPGMRTPDMARLELAMNDAGVFGGKAAGAGAGGCMFFLARSNPANAVSAAERAGARVLPVVFVAEGVRTW
jgi:D-glycero-alpha-D-manno-heptose-7-phosphate kinase